MAQVEQVELSLTSACGGEREARGVSALRRDEEALRRLEQLEARFGHFEDAMMERFVALDEKGSSYSRVLNQRVEGLVEAARSGRERLGLLTVGLVLHVVSFLGALLLYALSGQVRVH